MVLHWSPLQLEVVHGWRGAVVEVTEFVSNLLDLRVVIVLKKLSVWCVELMTHTHRVLHRANLLSRLVASNVSLKLY